MAAATDAKRKHTKSKMNGSATMKRIGVFAAWTAIGMACSLSAISCGEGSETPLSATTPAAQRTPGPAETGRTVAENLRALCRADIADCLAPNITQKERLERLGKLRGAHLSQWKSADQLGVSEAALLLGLCYCYGSGGEQDYAKAFGLLRKSADAGNPEGMNNVGWMCQNGLGVSKDYAEALKWYRKSAEAGNCNGMNHLAWMCQDGSGASKDDGEALKWFRKSAEAGNGAGMFGLGEMYENGAGVSKDSGEALKWFRKSADTGFAAAMNSVGWMYLNGWGVSKDNAEALKWYRKSAAAGNAGGMNLMGDLYRKGVGVPKDTTEAAKWYRRVLDSSDDSEKGHARKALDELGEK
jgi:TPR repeat protein